MLVKRDKTSILDSRIREIKRKILHCKNRVTLEIYKSHIEFLESEKRELKGE